jgi:hypothetical protein
MSPMRMLGHGALAGLAGTAVMTVAQLVEMQLQKRPASTAPADALEKTLQIELRDAKQKKRAANAVHFAYGTAWGEVRAVLAALGLRGPTADLVHLGLVWGTALRMLPALGLAPPVREWGGKAIAQDLLLHAVYAVAVGRIFDALETRAHTRAQR